MPAPFDIVPRGTPAATGSAGAALHAGVAEPEADFADARDDADGGGDGGDGGSASALLGVLGDTSEIFRLSSLDTCSEVEALLRSSTNPAEVLDGGAAAAQRRRWTRGQSWSLAPLWSSLTPLVTAAQHPLASGAPPDALDHAAQTQ